jgi:chitinase
MLGLGFYGRSFTLKDTSCTHPGCAFDKTEDSAGGGKAGECTDTTGILTDYEINRVFKQHNPDVVYNEQAAVNWMTWDTNQWYVI